MSISHTLLELRTSRDSEHTPETAAQLFASVPKFKNKLIHKLLSKKEHLSFEILSLNQTIYFVCYCPTQLVEYIKSLFSASYPEIIITHLSADPLDHFVKIFHHQNETEFSNEQSKFLSIGHLNLSKPDYLPLKDYKDFTDIDPLSTVLSVLSKTQPFDKIGIQIVLAKNSESWRNKSRSQINENTTIVDSINLDGFDSNGSPPPSSKRSHFQKTKNRFFESFYPPNG